MKIFVCIKQVPDTETKIKLTSDGLGIDGSSVKWIVNPNDEYAVEEAIKLKEAHPGSSVHVFSVGPKKRVVESLRTAIAMGADEGIVIDAPDSMDSLSVAQILQVAIKKEGDFDLLLVGKSAIDDNSSSVGPMLAQLLGIGHTSVVSKLKTETSAVVVEREVEGGSKEIVKLNLPALISTTKGLNSPRYASLPGIMKAKKKILKELDLPGLNISPSRLTEFKNFRMPPEKPSAMILNGTIDNQISELIRLLRDEAKAL